MSILDSTPTTALMRDVTSSRAQAKRDKASQSRFRRIARRVLVGLTILFGSVAMWGGTAQAEWPWEMADNAVSTVVNFCGPENVNAWTFSGPDGSFFSGEDEAKWSQRKTYVPPRDTDPGTGGNGLERLQKNMHDAPREVVSPTYARYGFTPLAWQNYGASCFGSDFYTGSLSNLMMGVLVKFPMMIAVGLLHLALDNGLYDLFNGLISPITKVMALLFQPWMLAIVPIGLVILFVKARGSASKTTGGLAWILGITGLFAWMTANTSAISDTANNIVTKFTSEAACQLAAYNTDQGWSCEPGTALNYIDNSLWRGVPYQVWQMGQVGEEQAEMDRAAEANGKISWSTAILNGQYLGTQAGPNGGAVLDPAGAKLSGFLQEWNTAPYYEAQTGAKTHLWTSGNDNVSKGIWQEVPFLRTVKYMCNDVAKADGEGASDEQNNRWFYGEKCDSEGAGTGAWIDNFKGANFDVQFTGAFMGSFAALTVLLAVGAVGIYLVFQKIAFFILILFFPVFLAIGALPNESTRPFARKYGEQVLGNIVKQIVAVATILFISYLMSALLSPPPESPLHGMPWAMKPFVALSFFIALAVLALPTARILKAAAKGDSDVVKRTAHAPARVMKGAAKMGATAGVAMATGGTSLGRNALASGQSTEFLRAMGRMGLRGESSIGSALYNGVQLADSKRRLTDVKSMTDGNKAARKLGAENLAKQHPGKFPRDANGKLTPAGMKKAMNEFDALAKKGHSAKIADSSEQSYMKSFYTGYKERTGEHHRMDPEHPTHQRVEAMKNEAGRADIRERVQQGRAAQQGASWAKAAQQSIDAPEWAQGQKFQATMAKMDGVPATGTYLEREQLDGRTYAAANLGETMGVYDWDASKMDPRHPATAPLMEMQWAVKHGREDQRTPALFRAAEAVHTHGLPNKIESLTPTGALSQNFEPASLVATMPTVTDDMPWQDRLSAAKTFAAVAASTPNTPYKESVIEMNRALSNPEADPDYINQLKTKIVGQINDMDPTSAALRSAPPAVSPSEVSASFVSSYRQFEGSGLFGAGNEPAGGAPSTGAGYSGSASTQPPVDDAPYTGGDGTFATGGGAGSGFSGDQGRPGGSAGSSATTDRSGDDVSWGWRKRQRDDRADARESGAMWGEEPTVYGPEDAETEDGRLHGDDTRFDSGLFADDDEGDEDGIR